MIAPSLQEYFVDRATGFPLAAGTVTYYSDTNRTQLKNVYTISGSPPNYSYVVIPNPNTLSSVGTPTDDGGNDILPYYYPYDANGNVELYFITVYNAAGAFQFSREAFPNISGSSGATVDITNYIPNGQFLLHNNIPAYSGVTPPIYLPGQIRATSTVVAEGNWTFDRTVGTTSTDFVTFVPFGSYTENPTSSPKYAINISCTASHAGDTVKDLRINFADVNKFASDTQEYTFAITGQSNSGSPLQAEVIVRKNFGSGGDATTETTVGTLTFSTTYSIKFVSFVFGDNLGKTIGTVGTDTVSICLRFPPTSTYNFSGSCVLLSPGSLAINTFPTTTDAEFTYQALTAIPLPDPNGFDIYCPLVATQTGLKFSRSEIGFVMPYVGNASSIPAGYLLGDGSMYETQAYSTDFIPYARLQSLVYDTTANVPVFGTGLPYVTGLPVAGVGASQLLINTNTAGLVTNSADGSVPTNFGIQNLNAGSNAYGFTAYVGGLTNGYVLAVQDDFYIPVVAPTAGTTGFTVEYYGNNAGLPLAYQVFRITVTFGAIASLRGTYLTFSHAAASPTAYYLWFQVDGTGADPAPGGTGIKLNLLSNFTIKDVTNAIAAAISGYQTTCLSTITNAAGITPGAFFDFNTLTQAFYVWFQVNSVGVDPAPANKFPILVNVPTGSTAAQVQALIIRTLNSKFYAVPDLRGVIIKGAAGGNPAALQDDITYRYTLYGNADPTGSGPGTYQLDSNALHTHGVTLFPSAGTTMIQHGTGSGNTPAGSNLGDTPAFAVTIQNAGVLRSNPFNIALYYLIKY